MLLQVEVCQPQGHNVQEFTGTIQYKLWENVLSRLEVRWDHAYSRAAGITAQTIVALGPVHNNEVLLAANIAYQF